jgi:hypothetical protein
MATFGSLAAAAPATFSGTTITPTLVQSLSNYLSGWFGAVIGANSPTIEDMNALCFLFAYQLTYLMQSGIAEYDAATTYFTGDMVNSGGRVFVSVADNNTGSAITDQTKWRPQENNVVSINPSVSSPYTLVAPTTLLIGDSGNTFLVNTANAAMQFNLPAPTRGFYFTVKDSAGSGGTNNIPFHRNAAESFEGLAADYVAASPWGEWTVTSDGTNWFLVGR